MVIKFCFFQDKSKDLMVKKWEELGDIKHESACREILDPTRMNNIC